MSTEIGQSESQLGSLIAGARIWDLSHPLTAAMPNHSSHPEYRLVPYYRLGDFRMEGGYLGCNELIHMSGHSGTHLDALGHVARDGRCFGGREIGEIQDGLAGLIDLGINEVEPIFRRGVLVDVAAQRPGGKMEGGDAVEVADLEAFVDGRGVAIGEGDCVLVRTGWSRHWDAPATYLGEPGSPGVSLEAAQWLAQRGSFLVGSDTSVVECVREGSHALPVHMYLLAERGVHILENLSLEEVARAGIAEFLFVCLPLRLVGSSGSPVRPVAVALNGVR